MVDNDGNLTVSGSFADDDTGIENITQITGNSNATITLQGPNLANSWELGLVGLPDTLAPLGLPAITFTAIQNLIGGNISDEFRLGDASGLTINAGDGSDTVYVQEGAILVNITFDGGSGIDAAINADGGSVLLSLVSVETRIDRPLLFIPGFLNSLAGGTSDAEIDTWYQTRGISPTLLSLEPLAHTYDNLPQSLVNLGYVDGTNNSNDGTFHTAIWDWRVPVAPTDSTPPDGILTDATADSWQSGDTRFDTGFDYVLYWLDQAQTAWQNLIGAISADIDIITHSTGGLLARAYLQSAA